MATLGDVLKEQGYVLPRCLTDHIGGESVPGRRRSCPSTTPVLEDPV